MSVPGTEFADLTALPGGVLLRGDEVIVVRSGVPYRGSGAQLKAPRAETLADAATVTPASDAADAGNVAELSQASQIANPTGTPTDFQLYTLRIKTTTARALTYGSQFRGSTDIALPASTSGTGKTDLLVFQWNAAATKWDLVRKVFGF